MFLLRFFNKTNHERQLIHPGKFTTKTWKFCNA